MGETRNGSQKGQGLPPEQVIELFNMFWRWLLALGALMVGMGAVFGGLVGWAIYSAATESAAKTATETVKALNTQLQHDVELYRQRGQENEEKLATLLGGITVSEKLASDSAARARDSADKITENVAKYAALVDAAAKAGVTTSQLEAAAKSALGEYIIPADRKLDSRGDSRIGTTTIL